MLTFCKSSKGLSGNPNVTFCLFLQCLILKCYIFCCAQRWQRSALTSFTGSARLCISNTAFSLDILGCIVKTWNSISILKLVDLSLILFEMQCFLRYSPPIPATEIPWNYVSAWYVRTRIVYYKWMVHVIGYQIKMNCSTVSHKKTLPTICVILPYCKITSSKGPSLNEIITLSTCDDSIIFKFNLYDTSQLFK